MRTTVERALSALAVCATITLAGMQGTGGAAAAAADCTPTWTTGPLDLEQQDLWKYSHEITWCVVGSDVRVVPKTTHEEFSPRCVWVGDLAHTVTPQEPGRSWRVFTMGEFSCLDEDRTKAKGVNPWLIVVIHSDGAFALEDKAIANPAVTG